MNRKSMLPAVRSLLVPALGFVLLAAAGCVSYRIHVEVLPDNEIHIHEHAEMLPGVAESLKIEPRLAWTQFQASVETRGGKFSKDGLKSADGDYPLDGWNEFGQRGQAFKGIDEIERRTRPANAQFAVKDQYFYRDMSLSYKVELSEPTGASVDSAALGYIQAATGTFEIEVPGTVLSSNAKQRQGNVLSYPLKYGDTVDVEVTFRRYEWVAMVSVVLVALFLAYVAFKGIKAMQAKGKAKQRPA